MEAGMARLRIDLDRATFMRLVVAAAAERDKIARQLFGTVVVTNRTAVAVVPRPDVRPFVETLECQVPDEMTRWRKRRGSVSRVHPSG